jgi:N-acetylmuramoyl-L-alanine amidase
VIRARCSTPLRLLACLALVLAGAWPVPGGASSSGRTYLLLVGSRAMQFAAPPVVTVGGRRFISTAVLDELHPGPAAGRPAAQPPAGGPPPLGGRDAPSGTQRDPHSRGDSGARLLLGGKPLEFTAAALFAEPGQPSLTANAQSEATDVGTQPESHYDTTEGAPEMRSDEDQDAAAQENLLTAPSGQAGPPQAGRVRYRLGAHTLDVAGPGQPLAAELNGQAVDAASLFELDGGRYVAAALLQRLGLVLYYNSLEGCYALSGLVYRVEYAPDQRVLGLDSLTPLQVTGVQDDPTHAHFEVDGGFFASAQPTDLSGDPFVQRLGFKSQPQLGRSFLYLVQPRQTGFKVAADPDHGYARIDFGNYFRVASHSLTSSGEISLNVQLGAPAQAQVQMLDGPPRLVLDFPGVEYDDATQYIPVSLGATKEIRIGQPQPDSVRVVVELTQKLDYRVLSRDAGARYFVQLLPPGGATRVAERRGRTVMLDPGHGGSDEGTPGILPGSQEKVATLQIVRLLKADLEAMGYTVLLTRHDDRFVSLGARTDYANAVLPYVFVSIHCNSISDPAMTGAMTFRHTSASADSIRLAGAVQTALVASTGCVDKGVRSANFFVLRETVMPSVLVETGFMTNKTECARLLDPAYQAKVAHGVAQGIDNYVTASN